MKEQETGPLDHEVCLKIGTAKLPMAFLIVIPVGKLMINHGNGIWAYRPSERMLREKMATTISSVATFGSSDQQ